MVDSISKVWMEKFGAIKDMIVSIKDVIASIKDWVVTYLITPFSNFYENTLKPVFRFLADAVKLMLLPELEKLKKTFADLFEFIGFHKAGVLRFIEYMAKGFGVLLVAGITAVIFAIATLVAAINQVLNVVKFVIKGAVYSWGTFLTLLDMTIEMSRAAMKGFANMADGIKTYFSGVITFIKGVFSGDWKKAWEGVKAVFTGIFTTITSGFKLNVNVWIAVLNGFINGLNKIKIPSILGSKPVGINISPIPYLAKGGVIDSPTLAMVGESGREAIVPLENNTQWINELASKIGGGQPINLVVKLGEDTIAEKIIDYANDKSLRSGSLVFNI
jgi:hypothetical protein